MYQREELPLFYQKAWLSLSQPPTGLAQCHQGWAFPNNP